MNPYILNFPENPRLTATDGGDVVLWFTDTFGYLIPRQEHDRLSALVAGTDEERTDLYVSALMIAPHLRAFYDNDWTAVEKGRTVAARVMKAAEDRRVTAVTFHYRAGKLAGGSVKIAYEAREQSYPLPDYIIFNRFAGLLDIREIPGIEGGFDITLKQGVTFRRVRDAVANAFRFVYGNYRDRKLSTVKEEMRWQFLPYINALYLYISDHFPQEDALGMASDLLGRPALAETFSDIIGRGVKKTRVEGVARCIKAGMIEEYEIGEERFRR